MTDRWRINGWRSTSRRKAIEEGGFFLVTPDGRMLRGRPYRPKPMVYLVKMPLSFEVEVEGGGLQKGVAGEYLAVGMIGEMYVVRQGDVNRLYEEQPEIDFLDL